MSNKNRTKAEAEAVTSAITKTAIESGKAAVPKSSDYTLFVSAEPENVAFSIRAAGIEVKGFRDENKKGLVFRVPKAAVHSFRSHSFVLSGRLVEVKE